MGTELAGLKGSNTVTNDGFGYAVAISGTTAVVGAPGHAGDAGRAYVFEKVGTGWKQAAQLKGSDTTAGDEFGESVAISGTTAVVGAPGHGKSAGRAYVFREEGAAWKQVAELKAFETAAGDDFGYSVVVSGTTVVGGAPGYAKTAGRAFVFTKVGAGWKQDAELRGADTSAADEFGYSLAISGTSILASAPGHAKTAGRVYVFARTGAAWKRVAELKGSDTATGDGFGISVAMSGAVAVVGASGHAKASGRVYVFASTARGWKQVAEAKGFDTAAGDDLGYSVATTGTTVVASAPGHAKAAGRAYVFDKAGTAWKQVAELKASNTVAGDYFGVSVASSGGRALVGAPLHSKRAGRAYLFEI